MSKFENLLSNIIRVLLIKYFKWYPFREWVFRVNNIMFLHVVSDMINPDQKWPHSLLNRREQ